MRWITPAISRVRAILARPPLAVPVLAFVAYFAIARLSGNSYPFSTYPMYEGMHANRVNRIVAKTADGQLREVAEFDGWRCDRPINLDPSGCGSPRLYTIDYVDQEVADYVAAHAAASSAMARATPVQLVRHVWNFGAPGAPTSDCLIASCQAVLR